MSELTNEWILKVLNSGELGLHGQFVLGSNYTLLVTVAFPCEAPDQTDEEALIAVYKPEQGERPLWDFEYGSLEKREVAAFLVSEALGWNLVPPIVYRTDGPYGPGSVQLYIEHDPNYHYFNFEPQDLARLQPVVAFDLIINNADRKGGHILKDPQDNLWLIDHGLCFHQQNKLRTVLWDFAGEPIPQALLEDMQNLLSGLQPGAAVRISLEALIQPEEVDALQQRIEQLLRTRIFPLPDERQRQYPWPPV